MAVGGASEVEAEVLIYPIFLTLTTEAKTLKMSSISTREKDDKIFVDIIYFLHGVLKEVSRTAKLCPYFCFSHGLFSVFCSSINTEELGGDLTLDQST
jgi:hypothetical protein